MTQPSSSYGRSKAELMTETEHRAVQLLGEFAGLMREIVGDDVHDWTEACQQIHVLQHKVMAQAAARAYPERYRMLGETKSKGKNAE